MSIEVEALASRCVHYHELVDIDTGHEKEMVRSILRNEDHRFRPHVVSSLCFGTEKLEGLPCESAECEGSSGGSRRQVA
jgi:hypothetical protein